MSYVSVYPFPSMGVGETQLDKVILNPHFVISQNHIQYFICGITSEEQFNFCAQFSCVKHGS